MENERSQIYEVKFPEWAPSVVISQWREKLEEERSWHEQFPKIPLDTEESDVLMRLLTYPDMRDVWEKLEKHQISPDLFIIMVQLSSYYIEEQPHDLTEKEYEKWLEDVKTTAKKLAGLVQLSNYDNFLQAKYYAKRNRLLLKSVVAHAAQAFRPDFDEREFERTEPEYERWPDSNPGLLSENLLELANLGSDEEVRVLGVNREGAIRLEKPHHPNARRSYFIKKLTQLIRERTGQPLRNIVTATTSVVFDDPTITERQVIRIAP